MSAKVTKVLSSLIEKKRQIIKYLRLGKSDVQTSPQVTPAGVDSSPIKGMRALQIETSESGKTQVIGYISNNAIAAPGEIRTFSLDSSGNVKMFLHLKKDGTAEFGGNGDFMVRYSALETAFNDLQSKWNTFAGAYAPGGPASLGLPPNAATSTADIALAKISEIKTLS
jgi:hypothetical protein